MKTASLPPPGHAAYGSLTVRAGETTRTIPVYVTSDPLVLLDGFEGEQTVLTQNTDKSFVRFGSASARWDYRRRERPRDSRKELLLKRGADLRRPLRL